MPLDPEDLQFE